jgi:hypothetical protein
MTHHIQLSYAFYWPGDPSGGFKTKRASQQKSQRNTAAKDGSHIYEIKVSCRLTGLWQSEQP